MNSYQQVWWRQAKSDHDTFKLIRGQGVDRCHLLHYLQMVTEKIAKAYFWRSGSQPPRSHAGFVQFLRFLGQNCSYDARERVANIFTFKRFVDFQNWIQAVLPLAYELERLAPSLSNNGPNPEYPWPHSDPQTAPANYEFELWARLAFEPQGRALLQMIRISIDRFEEYADA